MEQLSKWMTDVETQNLTTAVLFAHKKGEGAGVSYMVIISS